MERYWAYKDKKIEGPFEVGELLALEGFCENSLLCEVGDDAWMPAAKFHSFDVHFATQAATIAGIVPMAPTTEPSAGPYQEPGPQRVSNSFDFMGPDFQLNDRLANPKPRLTPIPSRTTSTALLPARR